eukprot:6175385-Pleurochrysis_carterae.AAC.6
MPAYLPERIYTGTRIYIAHNCKKGNLASARPILDAHAANAAERRALRDMYGYDIYDQDDMIRDR